MKEILCSLCEFLHTKIGDLLKVECAYSLNFVQCCNYMTDSAEILYDCSLGEKDQVCRVKIMTLQHCSIPCSAAESLNTLWPISQPFLNGFC